MKEHLALLGKANPPDGLLTPCGLDLAPHNSIFRDSYHRFEVGDQRNSSAKQAFAPGLASVLSRPHAKTPPTVLAL
jgi:hypothetical protein